MSEDKKSLMNLVQGSPQWLVARQGHITASRMKDAMSFNKNGKSSQKREDYKAEIVCELLTGRAQEHYVTPAMDWGIEQQVFAQAAYEVKTDSTVTQVGLVLHDAIPRLAASPDGLVGEEGLVEFKCPTTTTHLGYLLDGIVPEDYVPQMNCQMACTGRKWCDFCSFDPRLPEKFQLFIIRFERDEAQITAVENAAIQFLEEVAAMLAKLGEGR